MSGAMDHRKRLAMLREEFAHADRYQDWVADWWASLSLNERALLLSVCGLDDTEAAARRPWRQHLQETRDRLLQECKRLARLIDPLRFA